MMGVVYIVQSMRGMMCEGCGISEIQRVWSKWVWSIGGEDVHNCHCSYRECGSMLLKKVRFWLGFL